MVAPPKASVLADRAVLRLSGSDRATRIIALTAVALALVGLVLAGFAVVEVRAQREDIRALGESVRQLVEVRLGGTEGVPLHRPAPALETEP